MIHELKCLACFHTFTTDDIDGECTECGSEVARLIRSLPDGVIRGGCRTGKSLVPNNSNKPLFPTGAAKWETKNHTQ